MARRSNQITFTEQKKILQIKEWYLALDSDNILTDNTPPLAAIQGQLWLNTAKEDDARLMQFIDGHWRVCSSQFTTTIQRATADKKYLWNYEEVIYSIGTPDISNAVIVGSYGSVREIKNYYTITQDINVIPSIDNASIWNDDFAAIKDNLSSTNKYLWGYEVVVYADGTLQPTSPAIIGVYGDSGKDAIVFQVYSKDGYEFVDSINDNEKRTTITLHLSLHEGSTLLTENVKYTWSWNNTNIDANGDIIGDVVTELTEPYLEVNITDEHAYSTLEFTAEYKGNIYKDYRTLTKKVDVYTANIEFFEGTNVIAQDQEFVVGYIDLYKNNKLEETAIDITTKYHPSVVTVSNKTINNAPIANTDNKIQVGDKMYFIINTGNGYDVILGEYINGDKWEQIDIATKYLYINNLNSNKRSNLFAIAKQNVKKSKDVSFNIYNQQIDAVASYANEETDIALEGNLIAKVNTIIIDVNDTIISTDPPSGRIDGQMWFNPNNKTLYIYNAQANEGNGDWEPSKEQQPGQAVYTSQPTSQKIGDLWIVEQDCEFVVNGKTIKFEAGQLLRAETESTQFDAGGWVDATKALTDLKKDIRQYMTFDPDKGMKIGNNKDPNFYVNISSTRMSFFGKPTNDTSDIRQENEVVYISNNSASISNLKVEDTMECYCPLDIRGDAGAFVFVVEDNGHFTLTLG